MKRLLILMLSLCLLLSILVSCNKDTTDKTPTTTTVEEIETEEPDPFEAKDFGKEVINVLMSVNVANVCYIEEEASNIYEEEIVDTYYITEDKYNVTFEVELQPGNGSDGAAFCRRIAAGHDSGANGYEYIVAQAYFAYPLAFQGYYKNLQKSDYINLDAEYYYQGMNDNLLVCNQIYGIAGSYNMDKISYQMPVFFNKTIHESFFAGTEYANLYDIVKAGNWTLDVMSTLAEGAKLESGDNVWDEKDQYGFIGVNGSVSAVFASGVEGISKSDSDEFTVTYYNERLVDIVKDWGEFFNKDYVLNDGTYNNAPLFTSGHALFYSSHLNTLPSLRADSDFNIGVLPFPKYDTTQTEYRTHVNRGELIYIPINANDEIAGTIVEYMNYQFYKKVVPAYWDSTMQGRYAATPEDRDMMVLTRDSIYDDFAYAYRQEFGDFYIGTHQVITEQKDVASYWQQHASNVQTSLDSLLARFQELESKGN